MSDGSQRPTFGRRSVRTPLGAGLRRMFAVHESAAARGLPVEAVLQELEQKLEQRTAADRPFSRRRFLTGAAVAGAGLALGPAAQALASMRPGSSRHQPRIAVVGAGLAGLRCR